jgi:lipoate-protein ligase A
MPRSWRLVDSGLVPPHESAALDEAILEAHVSGHVPNTLHFYVRSFPTVSVGYFQKIAESVDLAECERMGVAVVRRKSGGSSIYTDQGQLIYALVVHDSDLPEEVADSFRVTCQAIADAVQSFGIDAVYRPMNDVEVDRRKISGNAQLRRKGSVLQHGTIVIDTDISKMDAVLKVNDQHHKNVSRPSERITTLSSLLGEVPDMEIVKGALVSAFEETFDARFTLSSLTDFEASLVKKLVHERYSRKEWNFKL